MNEDQITEYRKRLTKAARELEKLSDVAADRGQGEASRLLGKAQGVRLAESYLLEYLRESAL